MNGEALGDMTISPAAYEVAVKWSEKDSNFAGIEQESEDRSPWQGL